MYGFMQFLASPVGTLVRLAIMFTVVIALFIAIGSSPHGLTPVFVGIGLTSGLLLMMRVPLRFVFGVAAAEFVIAGVTSLITQLAASGVFALLALVAIIFVLVAVVRWARGPAGRRNPVAWGRRGGLGPWWLPRRRRRYL